MLFITLQHLLSEQVEVILTWMCSLYKKLLNLMLTKLISCSNLVTQAPHSLKLMFQHITRSIASTSCGWMAYVVIDRNITIARSGKVSQQLINESTKAQNKCEWLI